MMKFPPWVQRMIKGDGKGGAPRRRRRSYWVRLHQATPSWSERSQIAALYREARRRRAEGEDVVVDHVLPLNGDKYGVCGLHVLANLEIVSRRCNQEKGGHSWPGQEKPEQLVLLDTVPKQRHLKLEIE